MKKKTVIIIIIILIIILLVVLGIILFKNSKINAEDMQLTVATIWSAEPLGRNTSDLDFANADSEFIQLARKGFLKGMQDAKGSLNINEITLSDNTDFQMYIRMIAETFLEKEVHMTVGCTHDEMTMYTSMEMNYFGIPMLIPFTDGNISPDNMSSDYSFRVKPTPKKYGDFFGGLFQGVTIDYINNYVFDNIAYPVIGTDVAVFFRDNINGHDTAVNITQTIMDSGYNIDSYVPFADLESTVKSSWAGDEETFKKIDSVIIIGEDSENFDDLSEVWHMWADRGLYPYFFMVGYEPNDIDPDLLNAENVFVIQPVIDFASCPAGITSRAEAMGYAGGQIMAKALLNAVKTQPAEPTGIRLWFHSKDRRREMHQDYVTSFRNNIRSALFELNEIIPCYGQTDFKNDPDTRAQLEMVRYTDKDRYEVIDPNILFINIIDKNREYYGLGE